MGKVYADATAAVAGVLKDGMVDNVGWLRAVRDPRSADRRDPRGGHERT